MSKKGLLVLVLILILGTIFYLFIAKNQNQNSFQSAKSQDVNFLEVELESLDLNFAYAADFVYSDTFNLVFKVGGLLEQGEVELERESSFKKNQLLFQINNRKAFSQYLQVKNQFRATFDNANQILEKLLLPNEILKWKNFTSSLSENQLITDFPVISSREEQKLIQDLNLLKSYTELKKLESNMTNYFFLAPFDGKVLELNAMVGSNIEKNKTVALLVSNKTRILKVVMDSVDFHQISSVQKVWVESNDFVQSLDWKAKTVVNSGSKVMLLFKGTNWNGLSNKKVYRFKLQGKTEKKFACIPSAFIREGKVKQASTNRLTEVVIQKSVKDSSFVEGLKAGMKIIP